MLPSLKELIDIRDVFKEQTPSSPLWFQSIDRVVGALLDLEIKREKDRADADESPF